MITARKILSWMHSRIEQSILAKAFRGELVMQEPEDL